jgi:hypothetical protein
LQHDLTALAPYKWHFAWALPELSYHFRATFTPFIRLTCSPLRAAIAYLLENPQHPSNAYFLGIPQKPTETGAIDPVIGEPCYRDKNNVTKVTIFLDLFSNVTYYSS